MVGVALLFVAAIVCFIYADRPGPPVRACGHPHSAWWLMGVYLGLVVGCCDDDEPEIGSRTA